jgi:hypothetical protein
MNQSTEGTPHTPPSPELPAPASWFRALVQFWVLKKVTVMPSGVPVWPACLLGAGLLALWGLIDWWQRQPDPVFFWDGVPSVAWYVLGVLALAALLRARSVPRPAFGAAFMLSLGLMLPLMITAVVATYLQTRGLWTLIGFTALYTGLFLARGLEGLTGRSQRRAAILGSFFGIVFIGMSDVLDAIPDVWNPNDAEAAVSDEMLAARESALFEQADRIDRELDNVRRGPSAGAQTFFIGFAGVGDEKVFSQEIGLASRVLAERFGMGNRRLSLINDERDLDRAPLASVSGLNYALHGMAARMDLDRDVLFLAISSHGSEDPAIAVSNSQFPFTDLTDEDLADALHESGIKWRVIIISACYSGGFIKALRDPDTIVITAAAADRTSFGCSSDADLTYFGEAFYRDALPGARSIREAFDAAKSAIAARERAEGETPSNPQAYFGTAIEAKLATMSAGAP